MGDPSQDEEGEIKNCEDIERIIEKERERWSKGIKELTMKPLLV